MSVEEIQRALNAHGYNLAVDGVNGPKTKAAIKDFQRKNRLTVDGIVGPNTTRALQGGGGGGGGGGDLPGGPSGIGGRQGGGGPNDQGGQYRVGGLKSLMLQAGANEKEASTLAAIAMAESSGNSRAVNTGNSNGTHDYGLWQVNSIWTNDGRSREQGHYDHNRLTTDALYNARAALAIYRSSGYSAWATYNSGAYKPYLRSAVATAPDYSGSTIPTNGRTVARASRGGARTGYEWGQPGQNIVTVKAAGKSFQVNSAFASNFTGFVNALAARGYSIKTVEGFSNRNIAGTNRKSNHAYGAAIDINPGSNPRTTDGRTHTNMPADIVQLARAYGLGWGGEWKSSKDPMHFEVIGAPASAVYDGVKPGSSPVKVGETQSFAWLAALAGINPELDAILHEANLGATDEKIWNDLHNTEWWRTHNQNERNLAQLKADDPAQYKQQHDDYAQQMRQLIGSMGVTLGGGEFSTVFNLAFGQGWNTQQLQSYLSRYFSLKDGTPGGAAGSAVADLRQMAGDYAVPMSDATLQKWTRQIIAGTVSSGDFKSYLIEQAKGLYPTLAKALDKGITVDQYGEPYRQVAAQTLNVNPNQIDFRQAKWQAPLMQVDKTGERVPMSLDQWATRLKTDPTYGFDTTSVARDTAAKFSSDLLTQFGAKG